MFEDVKNCRTEPSKDYKVIINTIFLKTYLSMLRESDRKEMYLYIKSFIYTYGLSKLKELSLLIEKIIKEIEDDIVPRIQTASFIPPKKLKL